MPSPRVNPNSIIRRLKHYALYGENDGPDSVKSSSTTWTNSFHFEKIPMRSSRFNWEIEPHVHDAFVQILLLTHGSGDITINGAVTHLQSPALIVIPAQNVHGFRFSSNIDGPVITAAQKPIDSIAKLLMPELAQVLNQAWLIPLGQDANADAALAFLFAAIEREWHGHRYGHAAAGLSLLTTLLVHIGRYTQTLRPPQSSQPAVPARHAATVEKFKILVNEKFKSALSMQAYAERLGVSTGQLTRLTKAVLGKTSLEVVNARLIFEAERDLTYTAASIKQIAANLGFEDEAYFSRFFRKQTGLSPKAFRTRTLDLLT